MAGIAQYSLSCRQLGKRDCVTAKGAGQPYEKLWRLKPPAPQTQSLPAEAGALDFESAQATSCCSSRGFSRPAQQRLSYSSRDCPDRLYTVESTFHGV
jgi:hypothetical protein